MLSAGRCEAPSTGIGACVRVRLRLPKSNCLIPYFPVQIVARMDAAAAQAAGGGQAVPAAPLPRLALYSGHDTTIMPLLVTLGVDLSHWPAYVSNLVRLNSKYTCVFK